MMAYVILPVSGEGDREAVEGQNASDAHCHGPSVSRCATATSPQAGRIYRAR